MALPNPQQPPMVHEDDPGPTQVVIAGAGIVGLTLALALHEHLPPTANVEIELYDKVSAFHDDIGAGMGMYGNGLRVLRDISPDLLRNVRDEGHPYLYRRVERHDGTEVAVAEEGVLARQESSRSSLSSIDAYPDSFDPLEEDKDLHSLGIRRWRLHRVLYDAVKDAGIPVHFGKRLSQVEQLHDGKVRMEFDDGTTRHSHILFGVDGAKSRVRELVVPPEQAQLNYTGITCIMGMANKSPELRGIRFPSSLTTQCHACYFPTREREQCFQIHIPLPEEMADKGNWGTLSEGVGREECRKLSERLENDGWDEQFLEPLRHVTHAVRIGFCSLDPPLHRWVFGGERRDAGRIVLLGDAAHPPVPYTGQGAQMGLEDAGVIATLLSKLCIDNGRFTFENFGRTMDLYEQMRIPRTEEINALSKGWGHTQQRRASCPMYNKVKEEKLSRDVFFHETIPIMLPGVTYDYRADVERILIREGCEL